MEILTSTVHMKVQWSSLAMVLTKSWSFWVCWSNNFLSCQNEFQPSWVLIKIRGLTVLAWLLLLSTRSVSAIYIWWSSYGIIEIKYIQETGHILLVAQNWLSPWLLRTCSVLIGTQENNISKCCTWESIHDYCCVEIFMPWRPGLAGYSHWTPFQTLGCHTGLMVWKCVPTESLIYGQ